MTDYQLHNRRWPFQQRGHGPVAARATARCSSARRITAGICGTGSDLSRRAEQCGLEVRPPFTPFLTTAKGICGLRPVTASPAATATKSMQRRLFRTGWSSALPMGCAAARRPPTAILRHGARAMGTLWFATPKGLVEIDPAHFPVNSIPPPVALERFAVDDVDQPLRGADSLTEVSAGHVHFEFDYAGLSFIAPQKVRYRYMLRRIRPRLDRGRHATQPPTTPISRRATTPFACRRPTTTGCGTRRVRRSASNCGRIFIRRSGSMRCSLLAAGGQRAFAVAATAAPGASGNSARCWASAAASRARFTTRWPRATWASRCSWKSWPSCCAEQGGRCGKAS